MLRSLGLTGIVITISFAVASQAAAFGFGPVFKYGNHKSSMEEVDENFDLDYTGNHFGIGIQLDTNVAKNRLFNYRVEILFESIVGEADYNFGVTDELDTFGVGLDQTFGFGLYRGPAVRIFLGPTLRFGVWAGEGKDDDLPPPFDTDTDYVGVDIGLGLTLGANFHLGNAASISTTIGYIPGVGVIVTDDDRLDLILGENDYVYDGYHGRLAVGLSLLFRTPGDKF